MRENEEMLFQASSTVQHPQVCRMPDPSTKTGRGRRLGESIARGAAEKACARVKDSRERDACIFDAFATGDLEVAYFDY